MVLAQELKDIEESGLDIALTGFDSKEIDDLLASLEGEEPSDEVPLPPAIPASRTGSLWLCGPHRVLFGDSTDANAVARLLGDNEPFLMVTDPPYGIELDSEWRDRAGLNGYGAAEPSYLKHRTAEHNNTTISSDTRAHWSDAFELVPSLQVAYVWHASVFTREVLNGLERIGFLYPQQIIWNKGRIVLKRTHYWYQHEPCWYVRKKNAPRFGQAGENSTAWGFRLTEIHYGRLRRREIRSPDAEAARPDDEAHSESQKTRRIGLRAISWRRANTRGCGNNRAGLLRHRARPEVHVALALLIFVPNVLPEQTATSTAFAKRIPRS